jgi:hypothetical protein
VWKNVLIFNRKLVWFRWQPSDAAILNTCHGRPGLPRFGPNSDEESSEVLQAMKETKTATKRHEEKDYAYHLA